MHSDPHRGTMVGSKSILVHVKFLSKVTERRNTVIKRRLQVNKEKGKGNKNPNIGDTEQYLDFLVRSCDRLVL